MLTVLIHITELNELVILTTYSYLTKRFSILKVRYKSYVFQKYQSNNDNYWLSQFIEYITEIFLLKIRNHILL